MGLSQWNEAWAVRWLVLVTDERRLDSDFAPEGRSKIAQHFSWDAIVGASVSPGGTIERSRGV